MVRQFGTSRVESNRKSQTCWLENRFQASTCADHWQVQTLSSEWQAQWQHFRSRSQNAKTATRWSLFWSRVLPKDFDFMSGLCIDLLFEMPEHLAGKCHCNNHFSILLKNLWSVVLAAVWSAFWHICWTRCMRCFCTRARGPYGAFPALWGTCRDICRGTSLFRPGVVEGSKV